MIIIILTIDMIRSIYCQKHPIPTQVKYLTILTMFFYCLTSIAFEVQFIYILLTYHNTNNGISYISSRIGIFSWELALYLMLCTYFMRIHNSFKSSFLRLKKSQINCLYALCIILALCGSSIVIFILLKKYRIRDILAIVSGTFYVILSIVLMRLFIRRIDRVMLGKFNHIHVINDNMIQQLIDNDLINLFVRNALLTSISICCAFLGIAGSIIQPNLDPNSDIRYPIYGYLGIVITVTMNVISMYLLFGFNTKVYNKLCISLHILCKKCKVKQITRNQRWDKTKIQKFSVSILEISVDTQQNKDDHDIDDIDGYVSSPMYSTQTTSEQLSIQLQLQSDSSFV